MQHTCFENTMTQDIGWVSLQRWTVTVTVIKNILSHEQTILYFKRIQNCLCKKNIDTTKPIKMASFPNLIYHNTHWVLMFMQVSITYKENKSNLCSIWKLTCLTDLCCIHYKNHYTCYIVTIWKPPNPLLEQLGPKIHSWQFLVEIRQ